MHCCTPIYLCGVYFAIGAGFQKKIFLFGNPNISLNRKSEDIMKIAKNSGTLFKGANKTIENELKGQRSRFVLMLLGTLSASLLGSLLSGEGVICTGHGVIRAGKGTIRP